MKGDKDGKAKGKGQDPRRPNGTVMDSAMTPSLTVTCSYETTAGAAETIQEWNGWWDKSESSSACIQGHRASVGRLAAESSPGRSMNSCGLQWKRSPFAGSLKITAHARRLWHCGTAQFRILEQDIKALPHQCSADGMKERWQRWLLAAEHMQLKRIQRAHKCDGL